MPKTTEVDLIGDAGETIEAHEAPGGWTFAAIPATCVLVRFPDGHMKIIRTKTVALAESLAEKMAKLKITRKAIH